ncbi:replication associated protein [Lynx canadensis faeces associated genomovirus CL1 46]|uniref:Replication associated protein n=1 Tax=Lynx canadensis faeces associated genomovirus CL1 46 TaxID=2219124 RepID=A0A2Z5CHJ4_9VIRU|nr:replication associated protein [Lynx canadensis faeces associated genomovirus CL1 46]AXB22598.1 replication associated protein [Lynx canadensis faeces associated genomovirus CL1 46]
MPFVCNARYFLVTYSHVEELDPFALVEFFGNLGAECIVGLEPYNATFGIHFHVFTDFGRKFRSRRTDIFDVNGFHPNISPSRGTPEAGYDYAIKNGDVVAGGLARPSGVGNSGRAAKWHQIVDAETRDEFFDLCEELDPERLVCSFSQIQKYADWRFAENPEPYASPDGVFDLANYGDLGESKSLILWGPSRMGKTVWARSLGDHLYFGGIFSARDIGRGGIKYAVFDDIAGGIKFFPRFKDWLGCQMEFMVKEMYRDPHLFKWGRPAIWIANTDPRHDMSHEDVTWLEANCIFVEIDSAIFHANTE